MKPLRASLVAGCLHQVLGSARKVQCAIDTNGSVGKKVLFDTNGLDWSLAKVVKQLRAYRLGQELEFREFMESVRRLRIVNITFDDAGNS
ncbi:hypothetical protein Droror1_Dr00027082 [Drosera rotundifolia]